MIRHRRHLITACLMAGLTTLMLWPTVGPLTDPLRQFLPEGDSAVGRVGEYFDHPRRFGYLLHAIVPVLFAAAAAILMCPQTPSGRRRLYGALVGYGVTTEVLQLFVDGRTFDWADMGCNVFALVAGAWLVLGRNSKAAQVEDTGDSGLGVETVRRAA